MHIFFSDLEDISLFAFRAFPGRGYRLDRIDEDLDLLVIEHLPECFQIGSPHDHHPFLFHRGQGP